MNNTLLWSLAATNNVQLPHFVRAHDCYYFDDTGKRYIDGVSGHWSAILGHSATSVKEAIARQLDILDFVPLARATHSPAVSLAERLASLTPGDLQYTFFGTSGTEAVETAIKLTYLYFRRIGQPHKNKIIYLDKAYHGSTLGSLSASGDPIDHELFGPLLDNFIPAPSPNCHQCPFAQGKTCDFDCANAVAKVVERENPETVAAIIVEPVIGSGGIIVPREGYLAQLRKLCDNHHMLLIIDEVSTGIGRTGTLFRSETENVVPDMLLIGKGITAAYFPLSATVVRPHIYDVCTVSGTKSIGHDYTCGGHPAGCSAALEVLHVIEEHDLLSRVRSLGEHLLSRLQRLRELHVVVDVRGIGLMSAIELDLRALGSDPAESKRLLKREFLQEGLLCSSETAIKLLPPFITPVETLDEMTSIVERVLRKISK